MPDSKSGAERRVGSTPTTTTKDDYSKSQDKNLYSNYESEVQSLKIILNLAPWWNGIHTGFRNQREVTVA